MTLLTEVRILLLELDLKQKQSMPYKDKVARQNYNKEYGPRWHDKNKTERNKQIADRKREIQKFISSLKTKCTRCEETNKACLDFHHTVPGEKEICLSSAASRGWCIERILKEIAKCELMCSNCHRKEHDK